MLLNFLLLPFKMIGFIWHFCSGFIHFLFIIFFLILFFFITALFSFNLWFPKTVKFYVSHNSDFELTIHQSQCFLWCGHLNFHDIEIKNPSGKFSQDNCLKMDHFMVKTNLLSILKTEMIIDEIVIDIDKIVCDKANNGDINVLEFKKIFITPEDRDSKNLTKTNKEQMVDRKINKRRKHFGKKISNVIDSNKSSSSILFPEKIRFVIKKMTVHVGNLEFHNVIGKNESKTISVNYSWNFVDVRSKEEVINRIATQLEGYGVSMIIENLLGSFFDLAGMKTVKNSIRKVSQFGQKILKGASEMVIKILSNVKGKNSSELKQINPKNVIDKQ